MEDEKVTVETQREVKGHLVASFKYPTPMWATWIFRVVFLATLAATIIISGDPAIEDGTKVRIFLYMKGFDALIWGLGRGIGIKKEDFSH